MKPGLRHLLLRLATTNLVAAEMLVSAAAHDPTVFLVHNFLFHLIHSFL